eukprot:TRINITY_DN3320_c0_g1_i1.p1 TRINITY_DN3320_c0_g1~~TRINITY_DN3320_c0_g1_i1.p1  ORF type:complete len:129 (-),score=24.86 TRINITY_DN3320_c0_g1_i1:67-453(-)
MELFEEVQNDFRSRFEEADLDGDGYLSVFELGELLTRVGLPCDEEEVEEMVREADVNGDGKLNIDEFSHMMIAAQDISVSTPEAYRHIKKCGLSSDSIEVMNELGCNVPIMGIRSPSHESFDTHVYIV